MNLFKNIAETLKNIATERAKNGGVLPKDSPLLDALETQIGEWAEQLSKSGLLWVDSIFGVASLMAVVPPGLYAWTLNFLGSFLESGMVKKFPQTAGIASVLDTLISHLGIGMKHALEDADSGKTTLDKDAILNSLKSFGFGLGKLKGSFDAPVEAEDINIFSFMPQGALGHYAGAFHAVEREAIDDVGDELVGYAFRLREAFQALANNATWAGQIVQFLDPAITYEQAVAEPMKYSHKLYMAMLTLHKASWQAKAMDAVDKMVNMPAVRKVIGDNVNAAALNKLMDTLRWVGALIIIGLAAYYGILAIITIPAFVLWGLGLLLTLAALLTGINMAVPAVMMTLGAWTLFIARLFVALGGNIIRGVQRAAFGHYLGEAGLVGSISSMVGKLIDKANPFTKQEGGQAVDPKTLPSWAQPEAGNTGFMHRIATGVMLGVMAISFFAVLIQGSWMAALRMIQAIVSLDFVSASIAIAGLALATILVAAIDFFLFLHDFLSRNNHRYSEAEKKDESHTIKVVLWVAGSTLIALLLLSIVCGGALPIILAILQAIVQAIIAAI